MKRKVCPVCNQKISESECNTKDYRKFVCHCPYCGATLKKKFDIKILIALIAFGLTGALINTHWIFLILTIISAVALWVVYFNTPYKPYE
jgi:hypothetical protein